MTFPVTDLPLTEHPATGRYTRTSIRETSRVGSPVDGRERQQTTAATSHLPDQRAFISER
jgi:hypothetical protein